MKIGENTIISKSVDLLEAPMDDSLALMSIESGKYYGLNTVGRVIWELLEEAKPYKEIITSLLSRFDIGELECNDQCKKFLDEMLHRKMIKID